MITLLNAAPDTGNQGVSALCHSVVAGLVGRGADRITVADHGRGQRQANWGYTTVDLVGLTHNRRFWRSDSLRTARAMARIGGGIGAPARAIKRSKAVLDISGGDSFTDIYGRKRFEAMALTKRMALDAGVPLILLPQKLGPFRDKEIYISQWKCITHNRLKRERELLKQCLVVVEKVHKRLLKMGRNTKSIQTYQQNIELGLTYCFEYTHIKVPDSFNYYS